MQLCGCGSLLSSLLSPSTSNVMKRPFKLSEPHSDPPRSSSICARLVGGQAGTRLDEWTCKYLVWLLGVLVVSIIVQSIWPSASTYPVYSFCLLVPSALTALCLNVGVVKGLLRVAGVWYFILSVIGGRISFSLVWGPRFG